MNGDGRTWRAPWRRRCVALGALAVALALLSGLLATVYIRPYGHRAPSEAHLGLAVGWVAVLRGCHLAAAAALVAVGVAALALIRRGDWRALDRRRRWAVAIAAGLGLALLAGGLATPWMKLLPWAPVLGPNLARPMPLLGHDGPFPELVGVNVRYDGALVALGRLRLGPRGVGRLYLAHVVFLPVAGAVGLTLLVRRRRR